MNYFADLRTLRSRLFRLRIAQPVLIYLMPGFLFQTGGVVQRNNLASRTDGDAKIATKIDQ